MVESRGWSLKDISLALLSAAGEAKGQDMSSSRRAQGFLYNMTMSARDRARVGAGDFWKQNPQRGAKEFKYDEEHALGILEQVEAVVLKPRAITDKAKYDRFPLTPEIVKRAGEMLFDELPRQT